MNTPPTEPTPKKVIVEVFGHKSVLIVSPENEPEHVILAAKALAELLGEIATVTVVLES